MKRTGVAVALGLMFVLGIGARATTLYWDGTPGTADGASSGGNGTWSSSAANWDTGSGYQAWTTSTDDAVFGGTAGTVTLGSAITANTLTLNTASYIFELGANNLSLSSLVGSVASTFQMGATGGSGGTLTISGASSSYSGGITLGSGTANAGTVILGNNSSLGTGTLTSKGAQIQASSAGLIFGNTLVISAGGLRVGGSNDFELSGAISQDSANRSLYNYGSNTVTLSGNWTRSTYTTTFEAGNFNISGIMDGSAAITVGNTAAGTVVFSGANTYSGAVTVSKGTLKLGHATALGTTAGGTSVTSGAVLDLNGQTVTNTEGLTLNGTGISSGGALINSSGTAASFAGAISLGSASSVGGSGNATLSGIVSGGNALTKVGGGTVTFTGKSTYTEGTTISGGVLKLSGAGSLYSTAHTAKVVTINSGGTLELANFSYVTNGGSGSLGMLGDYGNFRLLNGGTINVVGATHSSGNDFYVANGSSGIFNMTTSGQTLTLNGNGNTNIAIGGALTFGGAGGITVNEVIENNTSAGSVIYGGSGTLTLGAANTFTGSLSASSGTVVVSNTLRSVSGVTANSGSTIQINATNMFVAGHGSAVSNTMVLTAAGTGILQFNSIETRIGNVTLSNGGTVTSNRALTSYDVLLANTSTGAATVTVSGTSASSALMNGTGGIHLQGVQNFDVANVTGNSNTDLTVSMILASPGSAGGSAGGINKTGAGTMSLTNAGNTFNGDITIANGVLIGTGVSGNTNTALGVASGSRTITVNSGGTLALVGNNVFGGGAQTLANTPKVVVNSGGTMTINTYNVVGNIDLNGGTLTATGSSNASYQTYEFNGSTITVGGTSASTISSSASSNGGMHIAGTKTLTLNVGDLVTGPDLTISAALINGSSDRSGNGALLKTGAGTVLLSGANTYSNGTTISAGTIVASNASALSTSGTVTLNDAGTGASNTSLLLDSFTISRAITIANQGSGTTTLGANGSVASPTFSGAITLAKDVTLAGSTNTDRLTFTGGIGGTGNVTVTGNRVAFDTTANTYAGTTTINSGGILQLGVGFSVSASLLPDTYGVSVAGTLKLAKAGNTETIGGLSGAGTVEAIFGSDTLSVGGGDATASFSGVLRNNGATLSLTKTGAGTQTLSGPNTYTGATTVSGGTLSVTGSLAAGSSVGVGSSATLGGTGTVNGGVTINNGGILAPGVSGSGTLTLGSLTLGASAGDVSTISIGVAGSPGSAATSSALQVNGNITANGGAGTATFAFGTALANLGNGTYNLVTYTGTQLSDLSAFAWSGSQGAREGVTLLNGTKTIDLTITTAYPIWTGGTTDWSAGTGAWKLNTDNSDTYFLANDTVHFDGTAASGSVNLTADVDPLIVTFEGDTVNYNVGSSGGYKITAGQVIKSGTSTLTINNANTFSGGTILSGGTLTLGDGGALGSGSIALNGGTLDINGKTIANGMVLGGGALAGNGGTINGAISETGGSRALTVGSSLTLTGVNTYTGATTITAGTLEIGGSGQLGSGSYSPNIGNDGTLKINSTANQTLAGIVSGTGALVKDSTGTLTLTGVNTYGGATTINGGTLEIGGSGQLGSGSYSQNISNAGTLKVNTSANQTLSGIVSGAGALVKDSTGTLTLTGVNTYGGATTINGGTLEIGGSGQLGSGSYSQNISDAGTLKVNTSANQTLSGVISGAGALVKDSTGTLTLTGVNTYGGATTISAGTLEVSGSGQLGSGSYSQNISNAGTLKINSTANQTLSGTLSGAGALIKDNTGMLTISALPTSTGAMTVNGGTLKLTFGYSNSFATPSITINSGGTLDVAGQDVLYWTTGKGALTINGGTVTQSGTGYRQTLANTLTMTGGTLTSAGAGDTSANFSLLGVGVTATSDASGNAAVISCQKLALQDSGGQTTFTVTRGAAAPAVDLLVSGAIVNMNGSNNGLIKTGNGIMKMSAANTYTGATTLSAGTLILANQDALATTTLNYSAGTLVFDSSVTGKAFSIGGLSGSSSIALQNNAGTPEAIALTLGGNNATSTYKTGGVLSGAGSLTQTGSGSLYMSGTHTYTGTTTIAGTGYLEVSGGPLSIVNSVLNVTSSNAKAVDIWAGKLTVRGLTGTGTIVANGASGNAFTGTALDIATPTGESYTFGGALKNATWSSGVMAIEKTGDGAQTLTGANTYTGGTKITGGTLSFASGALGPSGAVTMNGGTLQWASGNTQDVSGRLTMVNGKTATFDTNGNDVTLGAGFGGATSGALTKTGAGTLTLSGSNTYTGATSVNGGTLNITGSVGGDVTVSASGLLTGTGAAAGNVTLYGKHSPGNGSGIQEVGGDLTYESESSVLTWELAADSASNRGTDYDGVDMIGTGKALTVNAGAKINLVFDLAGSTVDFTDSFWGVSHSWLVINNQDAGGTATGTFTIGTISLDPNSVNVLTQHPGFSFNTSVSGNDLYLNYIPEPATVGLVGLFGAVALLRRRLLGR